MSYQLTQKCQKDGCETQTTRQHCARHAPRKYKYVPCTYPGCKSNCKETFCHQHKPEYMKNRNKRTKINREAALKKLNEKAEHEQRLEDSGLPVPREITIIY